MSRLPLAAALLAAIVSGFWGCDSTEPGEDTPRDAGTDSSITPGDADVDQESPLLPCVNVPAPTSCPDPPVRYDDVRGIFGQRCTTPCHNGTPNGPWPFLTYDDAAHWENEIRATLLSCVMPPLDGGVGITADDKLKILTWLRCGVPE
ncbi:MAG TPA: hypothetical protein VI072_02565 [Polyangiaceae bacterium]